MTHPDDVRLMAFADGELTGAEADEMARLVEKSPDLKSRVEAHQMTTKMLNETYGPSLSETVPAALADTIKDFERPAQAARFWRRSWMAAAASLFIVGSVGLLYLADEQRIDVTELSPSEEPVSGAMPEQKAAPISPALVQPRLQPAPPSPAKTEGAIMRLAPPSPTVTEGDIERVRPQAQQGLSGFSSADRARARRELLEKGVIFGVSPLKEEQVFGARPPEETLDRERYQHLDPSPLKRVADHPVSTFSIDVDTGSYANVRRFLNAGRLPPGNAVRVEEMINYFDYAYVPPTDKAVPFAISTEIVPTFWNPGTHLLRIGIKGYEVPQAARPAANLVFLVDVSGSMYDLQKLPLLVNSLKLLTGTLKKDDRISIVVYAGSSGVVLEPVSGAQKGKIVHALEKLRAGGSTAGEAGIRLAYRMAEQARIDGGINRVILATDGDFNVGVADVEALKDLIERKRKSGIGLTTLGFGHGNYNEALMEQLADVGNGNYAYIDTLREANKVLVKETTSTLFTIAKDVKIQIEFNPAFIAEYRLIGYENRALRREDFSNDKVDAGDLGAGHAVTALYEVALVDSAGVRLEPLRYGKHAAPATGSSEAAFIRLRYKQPDSTKSQLIEQPLAVDRFGREDADTPTTDMKFAAAVAAYGQILKGSAYTGDFDFDDVVRLAREGRGDDPHGYRSEFIALAEMARALSR